MVFVGGEDSRQEPTTMATVPERSRSLHNFSLPCLKWGSQRQLRCVKPDNDAVSGGPRRKSPTDDGIEAVRKRLMLDLQSQMDKMKFAVLRKGADEIAPPTAATAAAESRPWNLRTRRAVCKEPNSGGGGAVTNRRTEEEDCGFLSPAKGAVTSPARRNDVIIGGVKRTREKVSVSVSLSRNEIEEDFIAITGTRPPRRPKKRPRNVQKQLDTMFPGLWLSEITPEMYKVNEDQEGGKR